MMQEVLERIPITPRFSFSSNPDYYLNELLRIEKRRLLRGLPTDTPKEHRESLINKILTNRRIEIEKIIYGIEPFSPLLLALFATGETDLKKAIITASADNMIESIRAWKGVVGRVASHSVIGDGLLRLVPNACPTPMHVGYEDGPHLEIPLLVQFQTSFQPYGRGRLSPCSSQERRKSLQDKYLTRLGITHLINKLPYANRQGVLTNLGFLVIDRPASQVTILTSFKNLLPTSYQ